MSGRAPARRCREREDPAADVPSRSSGRGAGGPSCRARKDGPNNHELPSLSVDLQGDRTVGHCQMPWGSCRFRAAVTRGSASRRRSRRARVIVAGSGGRAERRAAQNRDGRHAGDFLEDLPVGFTAGRRGPRRPGSRDARRREGPTSPRPSGPVGGAAVARSAADPRGRRPIAATSSPVLPAGQRAADAQAGAGERVAPDDVVGSPVRAQLADLHLVQVGQRNDNPSADHPVIRGIRLWWVLIVSARRVPPVSRCPGRSSLAEQVLLDPRRSASRWKTLTKVSPMALAPVRPPRGPERGQELLPTRRRSGDPRRGRIAERVQHRPALVLAHQAVVDVEQVEAVGTEGRPRIPPPRSSPPLRSPGGRRSCAHLGAHPCHAAPRGTGPWSRWPAAADPEDEVGDHAVAVDRVVDSGWKWSRSAERVLAHGRARCAGPPAPSAVPRIPRSRGPARTPSRVADEDRLIPVGGPPRVGVA